MEERTAAAPGVQPYNLKDAPRIDRDRSEREGGGRDRRYGSSGKKPKKEIETGEAPEPEKAGEVGEMGTVGERMEETGRGRE